VLTGPRPCHLKRQPIQSGLTPRLKRLPQLIGVLWWKSDGGPKNLSEFPNNHKLHGFPLAAIADFWCDHFAAIPPFRSPFSWHRPFPCVYDAICAPAASPDGFPPAMTRHPNGDGKAPMPSGGGGCTGIAEAPHRPRRPTATCGFLSFIFKNHFSH